MLLSMVRVFVWTTVCTSIQPARTNWIPSGEYITNNLTHNNKNDLKYSNISVFKVLKYILANTRTVLIYHVMAPSY